MDVVLGVRKLVLRADKTSNYQYWSEEMEKYLYRHYEDVGDIIRLEKHHVFEPPKADLAALKALRTRETILQAKTQAVETLLKSKLARQTLPGAISRRLTVMLKPS